MIKLISEAKSICLDADDVTADFFPTFLEWYNLLCDTSFRINDFWTRKFHLVLGCTAEEAIQRIDDFQHSLHFKKILPVEGSVKAINYLSAIGKKLYIVTARADYTQRDTKKFYDSYFKGKISDIFHSTNHHTARENSGQTKEQICRDLRAPLIDDDLEYILPCAERAFGGILFGDYLWNQNGNLPKNVQRTKNWKEIFK